MKKAHGSSRGLFLCRSLPASELSVRFVAELRAFLREVRFPEWLLANDPGYRYGDCGAKECDEKLGNRIARVASRDRSGKAEADEIVGRSIAFRIIGGRDFNEEEQN